MPLIFNTTDVVCDAERLIVDDDAEVFGSKPYIWSIFFKLDGDSVDATIDLDSLSLHLDGEATVVSPQEGSHGNLIPDGGVVNAPPRVRLNIPNSVGRHKFTLKPMPTTINIGENSWLDIVADDVVIVIQDIIDWVNGDHTCPPLAPQGGSQLLADAASQFVSGVIGGLPGTFGALYLVMEEHLSTEEGAEAGRLAVRDELQNQLNIVIHSITLEHQAPTDDETEAIEKEIAKAVTDAMVANLNYWWLLLGVGGLLALGPVGALLGLAAGIYFVADHDNNLGHALALSSHMDVLQGNDVEIDEHILAPDGNGDWTLQGRLGADI